MITARFKLQGKLAITVVFDNNVQTYIINLIVRWVFTFKMGGKILDWLGGRECNIVLSLV